MCGRYSWAQKKALPSHSSLPTPPQSVSYNRAPGQEHPISIQRENSREWTLAKWGLDPLRQPMVKHPSPINARIETVLEKPVFQNSILHRRCLVPADGYFEWQKIETQKYPHFHFLPGPHSFAMAGIWNESKQGGQSNITFAVLTHSASPDILPIHHRMPVILRSEDWLDWMSPQSNPDLLVSRYAQCQHTVLAHQVSSRVNRVHEDDPGITDPFSEKQTTLW